MSGLNRTLFGFDMRSVNRYLVDLKRYSELDLCELQDRIQAAHSKIASLQLAQTASEAATAMEAEQMIELESEIPAENISAEEDQQVQKDEQVQESEPDLGFFTTDDLLSDESHSDESHSVNGQQSNDNRDAAEETQASLYDRSMGKLLMFRRRMDGASIPEDTPEESLHEKPEGLGFWDSIDQYMEAPAISEEMLNAPDITVSAELVSTQLEGTNGAAGLPRFFNYSLSEAPENRTNPSVYENETSQMKKAKNLKSLNPMKPTAVSEQETNTSSNQGSAEISREVRHLRYKYIVGKYAGEDLLDLNHNIIIKKGSQITESIIDRADQEGKLAQLIIHMCIPGIEEEN